MLKSTAHTNSSSPSGLGHNAYVAAFVAILLAAGALRVTASLNEFWLDEVWSYFLAGEMKGPADALTRKGLTFVAAKKLHRG
jgi:hypothetical protein